MPSFLSLKGRYAVFLCSSVFCGYAVIKQSRFLESLQQPQRRQDIPLLGLLLAQEEQDPSSGSLFSIMRKWGLPYNGQEQEQEPSYSSSLLLDTLSIGTQQNLALLQAQIKTWASHKSIRYYFAATELDDADPTCYKTLSASTIDDILTTCKKNLPIRKDDNETPATLGEGTTYHMAGTRIPPGWICAQQRFAIALEKLGSFYKQQLKLNHSLPDFVLMQDDDSYYNMVHIEEFLHTLDPDVPLAEAPCLIQNSEKRKWSFPWGGVSWDITLFCCCHQNDISLYGCSLYRIWLDLVTRCSTKSSPSGLLQWNKQRRL